MAAQERGLTYEAINRMTIGQVVDYVMEYNERHEKSEKPRARWANQNDINNLFGG